MGYTLTDQQQAIVAWFAAGQGSGNLIVRARAGCTKTTTVNEGLNVAPDRAIFYGAFNKRIAQDAEEKIDNPRVTISTFHSLGFRIAKKFWPGVDLEKKGTKPSRPDALTLQAIGRMGEETGLREPNFMTKRLVTKLHSMARSTDPHIDVKGLMKLAEEYDLVLNMDDPWVQAEGWGNTEVAQAAQLAMGIAAEAKPVTGIDFDDMVYLAVRNKWAVPMFDLVVIDETQDMNKAQLELAMAVLKPTGRMCVVGDDRQAIYRFRGADSGTLDRIKAALGANELPLTRTFRCATTIVAEAKKMVPDFEAAPTNPEGVVRTVGMGKLLKEAEPGDYVLSRTNAPLVKVALGLIREGKRTIIAGRNFGEGLGKLVGSLATGPAAKSMPKFLAKLQAWVEKEVERATEAGAEGKVEAVYDKAETIQALAEGATGVPELQSRIGKLFGEPGEIDALNGYNGPSIVCSSVHKAKGLEAERVWVLQETLFPAVPCQKCKKRPIGCQCGAGNYVADPQAALEEQNIAYVAVTRARQELVYVHGLPSLMGGR